MVLMVVMVLVLSSFATYNFSLSYKNKYPIYVLLITQSVIKKKKKNLTASLLAFRFPFAIFFFNFCAVIIWFYFLDSKFLVR